MPKPLPASALLPPGAGDNAAMAESIAKYARDFLADLDRRESDRKAAEEQKRQHEQQRLRQIAPGLQDELTPTPVQEATSISNPTGFKPVSDTVSHQSIEGPKLNYLEFEQGLPPKDPWDMPDDDDMRQLTDVLGQSHITQYQPAQRHDSAPPIPKRPGRATTPLSGSFSTGTGSSAATSMGINNGNQRDPPPLMPRPKLESLSAKLSTPLYSVPPSASTSSHLQQQSIPARLPPSLHMFYNYALSQGHSSAAIMLGFDLFGPAEQSILTFCSERVRLNSQGFLLDSIDGAYKQLAALGFNNSPGAIAHPVYREYLEAEKSLIELGFGRDRISDALVQTRPQNMKDGQPVDQQSWTERAAEYLLSNQK